MEEKGGIKYVWGPLRALLRRLPERTSLLILSVVTGLLCGCAAVLLKMAIPPVRKHTKNSMFQVRKLIFNASKLWELLSRQHVMI